MAAAPSLGRFAQLCAIELFQEIGDARAGDVLIPMLDSAEDTVRDWAAQAVGELGVRQAVPAWQRAYAAVKERGPPLDWTEPLSIRMALTELGARNEVVPPRVAELERQDRTRVLGGRRSPPPRGTNQGRDRGAGADSAGQFPGSGASPQRDAARGRPMAGGVAAVEFTPNRDRRQPTPA